MTKRPEAALERDRQAKKAERERLSKLGYRYCTLAIRKENVDFVDSVKRQHALPNRNEAINKIISTMAAMQPRQEPIS